MRVGRVRAAVCCNIARDTDPDEDGAVRVDTGSVGSRKGLGRIRQLVAALAIGAVAIVGLAPPASAAGYGTVYSYSGYAYVRAQPTTNSAWLATAWNGYRLTIYCYTDAQWAKGNYWTNRWFQVAVPGWRYGGVGYVHASLVTNQPAVPRC